MKSFNKRLDRELALTSAVVLGALVAPAQALAQSSVTIFGNVDAAVSRIRQGSGTTTPAGATPVAANNLSRLDSSLGPGSRLGFRGTEDLGAGLKANFVLESGFGIDTGAQQQGGLLFGRQAWLGVSSSSGWSLSAGRQYSPLNYAVATSDAFGGNYWGNAYTNVGMAFYENVAVAPGGGVFQSSARVDNSLMGSYRWGPVTARLLWGAGNENARRTGRIVNAGVAYADGTIAVDISYAKMRQASEQITAAASPESIDLWHVGGSYDFKVVKVFAGAFSMGGPTNRANLSAAFTSSPFTYSWEEHQSQWIGARVPFGNSAFTAQALRNEFTYPVGPEGRSMVYAAAFEHFLSKRTTLYATYGVTRNNSYANAPLFGTAVLINPNGFGAAISGLSAGVRHTF